MLSKMFVRTLAALLLTFFVMCSVVLPVSSQSVPVVITGYVTVNGVSMNGVHVSSGGSSYTTQSDSSGHAGYYAIMPGGVTNGSSVTVSFSYDGHSTSVSVTASSSSIQAPTANIVDPTATPTTTPTATVTVTPTATATASSGGSGSGSVNLGYNGVGSVTPTASATAVVSATTQPTVTVSPTAVATAQPTALPEQGSNTTIYLVIGLIAVLALAGIGYFVFFRKP